MKYKTFKILLKEAKSHLERKYQFDDNISKAFGSQSNIMTDDTTAENIVNIIAKDMNDKNETVDWLFWEIMMSNSISPLTFTSNDIEYKGTIKNVYKLLKGKL